MAPYDLCVIGDRFFGWFPMPELPMPDHALDRTQWHWTMWPAFDLFGPQRVWDVGLRVLGYPPTIVDLPVEAELVERALLK